MDSQILAYSREVTRPSHLFKNSKASRSLTTSKLSTKTKQNKSNLLRIADYFKYE